MRKLLSRWLTIMLAGIAFLAGVAPTRATTESAQITALAKIVLADAEGAPAQFGVYLGHGLILTNWHPWTLDGRYYTDKEPPISPSRQIARYDDDGVTDPGEHLLDLAECDGQWVPGAVGGMIDDAACTPFGRVEGAGFIFPGVGESLENEPVPVDRLVYASRDQDVALLAVDGALVEARGVSPVRLSLGATGAESPVLVSFPAGQGASLLPAVLATDVPTRLPTSDERRLDGPWRVWSLILTAPEYVPEGSPVFDKASGDLVGIVWRAEGVVPGEHWVTPAAVWAQDLYAANESIQSPELAAVLSEAAASPVDGALTLHDLLTPDLGNGGIDVLHVALDLRFDLETRTLAGTAALDIRATAQGLATFGLDASGLAIEQVTVNGADVPFAVEMAKLVIELPEPVDYGTVLEVVIVYAAGPEPFRSPYMPGFDIGMFWGEATVSTLDQPDSAHTWFPINDHPSDRATYEFRFRVPEPLTAVANGELIETTAHDDGSRTFYWRMDQPMASYLTVVAIADYVAVDDQAPDGTPITHYVYNGQALTGREVFGYTDEALAMLETWFGPYPYASYGHVVAPVEGMALETQTMTTMPEIVMGWTELEVYELMVHELTHQWFGDTVTPGVWSDIWLNEGFARYAQWLARDERFGYEAVLAARSSSEGRMIADTRRTPLIDPLPEETFGTATYDKGGWVLHMLRGEIGDEAFFTLLQTWVTTFADRPATTLDFWQLAEQVSGQDLAGFFTQWVLQADDMPDLHLYWTETEGGVDVRLCPAADEQYTLTLPVRFVGDYSAALDVVIVLDDSAGVTASFALDFVPRDVQADAEQAVLAQVQVQPIDELPDACEGEP